MEKYLFTDETGGIKEVQSDEELNTAIQAASRPEKIKIWIFSTNEWISYADFSKRSRIIAKKSNPVPIQVHAADKISSPPAKEKSWLKKTVLFTLAGATVFLVYNFTRIRWEKMTPLSLRAAQPANVPITNADSLIEWVEFIRGQKLDRVTKTNFRIRNTWPERILLQLDAERDTSHLGTKYHDIQFILDNATGYLIDEAIVKLTVWKNNEMNSDTFHFNNTGYATPAMRTIEKEYRGDSLAISFFSIKAKSFNFCYSADKQSNYGNLADRWFCKDE